MNKKNAKEPRYRRETRIKSKKNRTIDTKQNPLSPKIYVPLIIFGIFVVIYALWNPFSPPSMTIGGKEAKLSDFTKMNVKAEVLNMLPDKAGGQEIKITFSGAKVVAPVPVKENLTFISNHGVLTFKPTDKYIDLSTGNDSITGILYGMKIPNDHIAIQLFSDQQKLVKQTSFQPMTFPVLIKKLYLQGELQKAPDQPNLQIGIYLKNNNRYEDNKLWDQYDDKLKQNNRVINVSNGGIRTTIRNNAIYYDLKADESIQATFYDDPIRKSQVVTELHRYVDGETIPKKYLYSWKIEFKNDKYSLIYIDGKGNTQRTPLKMSRSGKFETFSKAREIPEPTQPDTTLKTPDQATSASSVSSSESSSSATPSPDNIQSLAVKEVENRVLALLIKNWPTPLTQSQIKLFTITANNNSGNYTGIVTYTYLTNGQPNKIDVMNYDLKTDGMISYHALSQYSPNDFNGNIFMDVSNQMMNIYFGEKTD